MAAGQGFKTFATGDVLTAADTNGYLMQGIWTFADAAARDAAVTSPQEGNMCFLKDSDTTQYYSGSVWSPVVPASVASGLTKIKSGTFNTVANTGTTFDGVFTSTYDNYVVVVESQSSAVEYIRWQFRVGASTTATGYYGTTRLDNFTGGTTEQNASNATSTIIMYPGTYAGYSTVNVSGVGNTSERAFIYGNGFSTATSAATNFGYQQDATATYTGFILSVATGTMVGKATVYGLEK